MRTRTKEDEEFERGTRIRQENKFACKHCGHKQLVPVYMGKAICDWCNHFIFRDEKEEFKYRMNERLKRN